MAGPESIVKRLGRSQLLPIQNYFISRINSIVTDVAGPESIVKRLGGSQLLPIQNEIILVE